MFSWRFSQVFRFAQIERRCADPDLRVVAPSSRAAFAVSYVQVSEKSMHPIIVQKLCRQCEKAHGLRRTSSAQPVASLPVSTSLAVRRRCAHITPIDPFL